jgi:hypothetical protein
LGDIWRAVSEDGKIIKEGSKVKVIRVEGVSLVVRLEENTTMSSIPDLSSIDFTPIIISVTVLIVILIIAKYSIRIVRPFEKGVVERLGRFQRILEPGLSIIMPFVIISGR